MPEFGFIAVRFGEICLTCTSTREVPSSQGYSFLIWLASFFMIWSLFVHYGLRRWGRFVCRQVADVIFVIPVVISDKILSDEFLSMTRISLRELSKFVASCFSNSRFTLPTENLGSRMVVTCSIATSNSIYLGSLLDRSEWTVHDYCGQS